MPPTLPHSSVIKHHQDNYISDLYSGIGNCIAKLERTSEFSGLFRLCLGTHSFLIAFSSGEISLLRSASAIVRRIPLLCATAQPSLGYADLRKFLEFTAWHVYFREHPVEWEELARSPGRSFAIKMETPIAFCAHRNFEWYLDYARERLLRDKSKLSKNAIDTLSRQYGELSSHVHAAAIGSITNKMLDPLEEISPAKISRLQKTCWQIFNAVAVLLACSQPKKLRHLGAIDRSWFDWLVGNEIAKKMRGDIFGI